MIKEYYICQKYPPELKETTVAAEILLGDWIGLHIPRTWSMIPYYFLIESTEKNKDWALIEKLKGNFILIKNIDLDKLKNGDVYQYVEDRYSTREERMNEVSTLLENIMRNKFSSSQK